MPLLKLGQEAQNRVGHPAMRHGETEEPAQKPHGPKKGHLENLIKLYKTAFQDSKTLTNHP